MADRSAAEPNPDGITRYIVETFPRVDVATTQGATFFSLDPEKHWPNFATIVTSDAFDQASNLSREGVFRLNIGVSRETFERLVGDVPADESTDYAVLDRVIPHPVYARQHWVSILNPNAETFDNVVRPLLAEAHARVARQVRLQRGER